MTGYNGNGHNGNTVTLERPVEGKSYEVERIRKFLEQGGECYPKSAVYDNRGRLILQPNVLLTKAILDSLERNERLVSVSLTPGKPERINRHREVRSRNGNGFKPKSDPAELLYTTVKTHRNLSSRALYSLLLSRCDKKIIPSGLEERIPYLVAVINGDDKLSISTFKGLFYKLDGCRRGGQNKINGAYNQVEDNSNLIEEIGKKVGSCRIEALALVCKGLSKRLDRFGGLGALVDFIDDGYDLTELERGAVRQVAGALIKNGNGHPK